MTHFLNDLWLRYIIAYRFWFNDQTDERNGWMSEWVSESVSECDWLKKDFCVRSTIFFFRKFNSNVRTKIFLFRRLVCVFWFLFHLFRLPRPGNVWLIHTFSHVSVNRRKKIGKSAGTRQDRQTERKYNTSVTATMTTKRKKNLFSYRSMMSSQT